MPAVNPGISVSRVGGNAQVKAMKKVAGTLKLLYSQYRELQNFSQFGSDLDADTKARLAQGERIVEILKQDKNTPVAVGCQVAIIYAAVHNLMKDIELENIREYEKELYSHMTLEHRKLMKRFADGYYEESDQKELDEAVRSFTVMFLQMWYMTEAGEGEYEKYLPHFEAPSASGYVIPYNDDPINRLDIAESVYLDMLYKAKKYVHIMTPYLIIDNELITALTYAARRGVDVKLILPHIPDKKIIFAIARTYYPQLLEAGVKIYEYTPGFVHAKIFVSDDEVATVGTINLDYRSLYHHFENGCFMTDCDVVLDIRNDLQEKMKECREVTEKYRTGRSAYLRLSQLLMRLFAGLL